LTDVELGRLLFAVVTLLLMALGCGRIFERFAMPHVIGEITGGLLLGPTVLGHFAPDAYKWVFKAFPNQTALLSAFYWLGLVLLMFVSGFRIQRELTRSDQRSVVIILIFSVVIPMLGGWHLTALIDSASMMNPKANPLAFHLVLAIAAAVTSIPFISRIFLDLGLMGTRFARIVLMTATLQDMVLWTALAIATGLDLGRTPDAGQIATVIATTIGFIGFAVVLGPPLLLWLGRRMPLHRDPSAYIGYALAVCFALTAIASLLSINVVFGALLAGVVIGSLPHEPLAQAKQHITDLAVWFFVPIYFAVVGQKIDLPNQFDLWLTVAFIVASSALKFLSVATALRFTGKPLITAINYGVAMNTRGGPGIVLASVALEFNIITEAFFVTLVLASVITSLFTGTWLRWMLKRGYPVGDTES
jgi:Kef-type K+ transport system membrane component KefB